jgi:hypothetical protein
MPATKTRLALTALALCAALLAIAGCGGGGGESSSGDLASVAPPGSSLFVEGTLQPGGSLKSNVEGLAHELAGVEDLGATIVSKLEEASRAGGDPVDFDKEVKPWLGEKAAFAFGGYDGSDFSDVTLAVQSTDSGAALEFAEGIAEGSGESSKESSFEGSEYWVEQDGTTLGTIGEFLVLSESESGFREAVEASEGESLADLDSYRSISSQAPGGSLADVYVDIGGLVEEAGNRVDPQTEKVLGAAGIDVHEATALISLVPGSGQVGLDIASHLGEKPKVAPPATGLLESMPADSVAAIAAGDYGDRLSEGFDSLDANGIPGEVPPHKLKQSLAKLGVDLDQLTGSLEDVAVFATGSSRSSLGGALVFTTKNASQAKNTVANVGLLLRSNHVPGVTAIGGKAAGFSIHSPELGGKPVAIAAKGDRVAIGYGVPATLEGLIPPPATLAGSDAFAAAKSSLGDAPITGFVDGPAAVRLAQGLVSPDSGFQEALPYLEKVEYIAFGGGVEGDIRSDRAILGLRK